MSHRAHLLRASAAVALLAAVVLTSSGCAIASFSDAVDRAVDRVREADAAQGGGVGTPDDLSGGGAESDDGNTPIEDIAVGDCVNDEEVSLDENVTAVVSLDVVPCDGPHDSEVYGLATFDLDAYPGDEQLDDLADEQCFALFEPFVGVDYESSTLEYSFYAPTGLGWKYGDRDALCVLYDLELDTLTGSARDQGI